MTTKNPIEKAVLNNVKVDYAAGSLSLTDPFTQMQLRVGIADLSFMIRLQELLWNESKDKKNEPSAFFYDLGKNWGTEFYTQLSDRIKQASIETISKPQDYLKDEFIEHLNTHLSYTGIGQFRITEGNKFYIINLKNSLELSLEKPNANYINSTLCGFFAALFSGISKKPLSCTALSDVRSSEKNRFALSTESIITEVKDHLRAGKTEKELLAIYGNQHLE